MLTRRGFLRTALTLGAVAATAATAAPILSVITEDSTFKYKESLRLLSNAATSSDHHRANAKFDELLDFLHKNFAKPKLSKENIASTTALLNGKWSDNDLHKIPPVVADDIFPILIARLGLKTYQIPVDPSKLKEFDEFHDRYGRLIIESMT